MALIATFHCGFHTTVIAIESESFLDQAQHWCGDALHQTSEPAALVARRGIVVSDRVFWFTQGTVSVTF